MIVLDGEFAGIDLGPRYVVQAWILHVDDSAAIQTHKVVMLVNLRVKASGGADVASLGHEPKRHESAQDAVHGHAGDLRQALADRPVNLLGRRMILAVQNRFEHSAPLDSDRQAPLAMGG
jgi:hypothetical protein